MVPDLDGKRLELLKEAVPKVARVAFLWQPGGRENRPLTEIGGCRPRRWTQKSYRWRCEALTNSRAHSRERKRNAPRRSLRHTGGRINTQLRQVLDLAAKNRLPAMYHYSEFVEAGGLISYGPDNTDVWRRAGGLFDKILKGAKPGDIPVEQPNKFEFLVNLNAAKQIGLTIPPSVVVRAGSSHKMTFSIFDFGFSIRRRGRMNAVYSKRVFSAPIPTIQNLSLR